MSAFDPKQNILISERGPSRVAALIATITCLSLGGFNETARLHYVTWSRDGMADDS
jgi:hypothetical protein